MDAIEICRQAEIADPDSFFDGAALRRFGDTFEVSETLADKLRKSRGLRFILLAGFHDAVITAVDLTTVYGKDAVEWTVDFRGASASGLKNGCGKFTLRFLNGKFQSLFENMNCGAHFAIISDNFQELDDGHLAFKTEVFAEIPRHEYYDNFTVTFNEVSVIPVDK